MITFAYSYITYNKVIVTGIIEARNRKEAIEELSSSEGIKIISVVPL